MIYVSRDYTPHKLLGHRFTQYRCPSCHSYNVAIKSIPNIPDAPAIVSVGSGEMECRTCKLVTLGSYFQVNTYYSEAVDQFEELLNDVIAKSGDVWRSD